MPDTTWSREMERADLVLARHGVGPESVTIKQGPRDPAKINLIIHDLRKAAKADK